MTVEQIANKHSFGIISLPEPEREVKGCYIGDLLSWVMGRAKSSQAWITIMSNINIAAVASLSDIAVIVLAEGVAISDEITETAKAKDINIISSSLPAYETALLLSEDV